MLPTSRMQTHALKGYCWTGACRPPCLVGRSAIFSPVQCFAIASPIEGRHGAEMQAGSLDAPGSSAACGYSFLAYCCVDCHHHARSASERFVAVLLTLELERHAVER